MRLTPIAFDLAEYNPRIVPVTLDTTQVTLFAGSVRCPSQLRHRTLWAGAWIDSETPLVEEFIGFQIKVAMVWQGQVLSTLCYGSRSDISSQGLDVEGGFPFFAMLRPSSNFGGAKTHPIDATGVGGWMVRQNNTVFGAGGSVATLERFLVMSPFRFIGEIDEVRMTVTNSIADQSGGGTPEKWWAGAYLALQSQPDRL